MSSDSESEDLSSSSPPQKINPYDVLSIPQTASESDIKTAYRKLALKNHPDKVPASEQDAAKTKFQEIAFAYAILSDPVRRKRYDTTGSTSESIVDSEGFDWSDYYRAQFADVITPESIAAFEKEYKGSEEEKDDLLAAYEEFEGDMDLVYEHVMLSNVLTDDERFRAIIDQAIEEGEVEGYKKYTKETKKSRAARIKAAGKEAKEADEYAKELGVYDKLNGSGKKGKGGKEKDSEAALLALIQGNQKNRESMFDKIAEKYGAKPKATKGKKTTAKAGKKRAASALDEDDEEEGDGYDDIPDDEFERIQANMLKKAKKTK
ncbi:DnaJ domain containing protein [Naviculisporaceae sp. PSN 640]